MKKGCFTIVPAFSARPQSKAFPVPPVPWSRQKIICRAFGCLFNIFYGFHRKRLDYRFSGLFLNEADILPGIPFPAAGQTGSHLFAEGGSPALWAHLQTHQRPEYLELTGLPELRPVPRIPAVCFLQIQIQCNPAWIHWLPGYLHALVSPQILIFVPLIHSVLSAVPASPFYPGFS